MKKFQRFLAILLILVSVMTIVVSAAPKAQAAMSTSTYKTKMTEFINDARWKHKTSWGYYQKPKYASYDAIGCCAYAADFAGYVYGQKKYAWTSSVFTRYTGVDNIKSGDILQISGHWLVVLERSGNALYTAEGNWSDSTKSDYARITKNGWKIQNGKLYNILGKSYNSLIYGYHYKFSDDAATGGTSSLFYFTALPGKMSISDTDAVIAMKLNKPTGTTVSKYGANIYDSSGKKLGSVSDNSSGYPNSTYVDMWWTVSKGMGIKLSPGTTYQFEFWATVDGKTYTSQKQTFTTTGKPVQVTSISLSPASKTLKRGETVILTATITPSSAANKALTWTTSDSAVATVSDTGVVTAKAPGTAVITATAKDGSGKSGTATITVECNHSLVDIMGKNPTCTEPGLTPGVACTSCGKIITPTQTIPAKGHVYDNEYDESCNVCGAIRQVSQRRVMHMFRMYDPNSGEHFYTGSELERNNLILAGWNYEGIGFTFPVTTGDPVYRLYDPVTGEHLYTMNVAEKDALMAAGWNYEGIAFNSATSAEVPQFRLHNPNATRGAYHFTASSEERDYLMSLGWEYQGIGWYSCWK